MHLYNLCDAIDFLRVNNCFLYFVRKCQTRSGGGDLAGRHCVVSPLASTACSALMDQKTHKSATFAVAEDLRKMI